jgi:branched-chain amino acid transport system permease protein
MTDGSRPSEAGRWLASRFGSVPVERLRVPLGLLGVALLLRPVVASPLLLGYGQIATTMLIWMLFVASFNLLLGYTGLLSFGHAMFFGIGAYGVAIGITRFQLPLLVAAPGALVAAVVVAYPIARLTVHKGVIYFAMLTLAFGEAAHFVANYNPAGLTGGAQGITQDLLPEWIMTYRGSKFVVLGGLSLEWYYAVAAVFFVGMLALWQVVRSPFGRSLAAIRENEDLALAMGMNTRRYKVWAFTTSGLFAALAGVLLGIDDTGVGLSVLTVQTSGDAILMTVLGGLSYFFGPLVGVFVWLFSEDYLTGFDVLHLPLAEYPLVSVELSGLLTYWQFLLGLLFVVTVLLAPREGLWGLTRNGVASAVERVMGGDGRE